MRAVSASLFLLVASAGLLPAQTTPARTFQPEDVFATIETTRGFLSNGVSEATAAWRCSHFSSISSAGWSSLCSTSRC